jgi:predicted transcriptional regulator
MKRAPVSIFAHLEHCEDLLQCVFNLTPCETEVYRMLLKDGGLTAGEVAERLDRSPNSAYRFLRSLQACKLVFKKQRNRPEGGYYYIYFSEDPERVRERLHEFRQQWDQKIEELILEFPRDIPEDAKGVKKDDGVEWPPSE